MALGVGATLRHLREKSLEGVSRCLSWPRDRRAWVVGAAFILQVPDRLAQISLGVLTIGLGVYSYFNKVFDLKHEPKNRHAHGYVLGGLVLFFVGVLNGSLASGTGFFCTLWLVRWFGLDYRRAVVTRSYSWVCSERRRRHHARHARRDQMVVVGRHCSWASLVGGYLGAHWSIVKGKR